MRPTPPLKALLQAAIFSLAATVVPAQGDQKPVQLPTNERLAKAIVAEDLEMDLKRALEGYEAVWRAEGVPEGVRRHAAFRFALITQTIQGREDIAAEAKSFAIGDRTDALAQEMKRVWAQADRTRELDRMAEEFKSHARLYDYAPILARGSAALPVLMHIESKIDPDIKGSAWVLRMIWRIPGPLAAELIDQGLKSERQNRWAIAIGKDLANVHPEHQDKVLGLLKDSEASTYARTTAMNALADDKSGREWPLEPFLQMLSVSDPSQDQSFRVTAVSRNAASVVLARYRPDEAALVLEALLPVATTTLWNSEHDQLLLRCGLLTVESRRLLLERLPQLVLTDLRATQVNTNIPEADPTTPAEHQLLAAQLSQLSSMTTLHWSVARWFLTDLTEDDGELAWQTLRLGGRLDYRKLAEVAPVEDLARLLEVSSPKKTPGNYTPRREFVEGLSQRDSLPSSLWPAVKTHLEKGETGLGSYELARLINAFGTDDSITWLIDRAQATKDDSWTQGAVLLLLRMRPDDSRLQRALIHIVEHGGSHALIECAALRGLPIRLSDERLTKEDFETYWYYLERVLLQLDVGTQTWMFTPEDRAGRKVLWSDEQIETLLLSVFPHVTPFLRDSYKTKPSIAPNVMKGIRGFFATVEKRLIAGDPVATERNWFQSYLRGGNEFRDDDLQPLKHSLFYVTLTEAPLESLAFRSASESLSRPGVLASLDVDRVLSLVEAREFDAMRAAQILTNARLQIRQLKPDWRPSIGLARRMADVVQDLPAFGGGIERVFDMIEDPAQRVELFGALLRKSPNYGARMFACQQLARTGEDAAAAPLVDALFDEVNKVQIAARDALDILRLARTERARWERIRSGAVELDPAIATQKLFQSLEASKDSEEQSLILRSIGAVAPPAALSKLIELRKSERFAAQRKAIDAAIEQVLARAKGD